MRLVSYEPFLSLGIPGITPLKPERFFLDIDQVSPADVVLFPDYWQVNTLIYGLKKKIFPSPATYHLGHSKAEMTRAMQALFPAYLPETRILPNTPEARERILDEFYFPFVAKDIRSARGCGVYLINDRADFEAYADGADALYVQMRLPITRDLRVVWVGDRVVTAYWREAREGAFHNNVSRGGSVSFDDVPSQALTLTAQLARAMDIDYAGFDIAMVDGHCFFFEFNNRFGNQALHENGISLGPIIHDYLLRTFPPSRCPNKPRTTGGRKAG